MKHNPYAIQFMLESTKFNSKPTKNQFKKIQKNFKLERVTNYLKFAKLIESGYSHKPCVLKSTKSNSFVSTQIIEGDFDSGLITIEQFIDRCKKYNIICNGYYETFSSSDKLIKFRTQIILSEPITDIKQAIRNNLIFMQIFPECDNNCKDLTRIFLGTNKKFTILNSTEYNNVNYINNTFNDIELDDKNKNYLYSYCEQFNCLDDELKIFKQKNLSHKVVEKKESTSSFNKTILEKMVIDASAYLYNNIIDYNMWMQLGFSLSSLGDFGRRIFVDISLHQNLYNDDAITINNAFNNFILNYNGSITIATYFYYAKQNGYVNKNIDAITYCDNKRDAKRVSDILTFEKCDEFNSNQLYFIHAGTGCGKSYWSINILNKLAKKQNKNMLILVNRTFLLEQKEREILQNLDFSGVGTDNIFLWTYQWLEEQIINGVKIDLNKFAYVVCDEAHYFSTDSEFNYNTILSLQAILSVYKIVPIIFMSATGTIISNYLKKYYNLIEFNFGSNYNHILEICMFNSDVYIDSFLNSIIENNKKALVYVDNINTAKMYMRNNNLKNKSIFICSKHTEKGKNVGLKTDSVYFRTLIEQEKIPDDINIVFATSALDAGFNLCDEKLSDILIVNRDIHQIIQMAGRYRYTNGNKIKIHIHNFHKNTFHRKIENIDNKLKIIDLFRSDKQKFVKLYGNSSLVHGRLIYDCDYITDNIFSKIENHLAIDYLINQKNIYEKYINGQSSFIKDVESAFNMKVTYLGVSLKPIDRISLIKEYINLKISKQKLNEIISELNFYKSHYDKNGQKINECKILNFKNLVKQLYDIGFIINESHDCDGVQQFEFKMFGEKNELNEIIEKSIILHNRWNGMMYRCYDEKSPAFEYYGGRGIKVDDDWLDEKTFIKDLLPTFESTDMSIDRIDVDGMYSKDNVRFATAAMQAHNKRNTNKPILDSERIGLLNRNLIVDLNSKQIKKIINDLKYFKYVTYKNGIIKRRKICKVEEINVEISSINYIIKEFRKTNKPIIYNICKLKSS